MDNVILKLKNVFYKETGKGLLHDISLSLIKGENVLLFGPEKSGLDLVCPIILGYKTDFEGNVYYKDKCVKDLGYIESAHFKKEIGYLHPEHGLIANMSVTQNISLPVEYHSKLDETGIENLVNSIIEELGLDYCKDLRPVHLTNSEILRTAYGRAIALDPDILIAEHVFENQSQLNILPLIKSIKKRIESRDKSVIFITFEPEKYLDFVDKFIMLYNGRIVFRGSGEDFLNSDNSYLNQYKNVEVNGPMIIL